MIADTKNNNEIMTVGQYTLAGEIIKSGFGLKNNTVIREEFFSEIIKSDNTLHKLLKDQNEIYMVMYCTNPQEILRTFNWGELNYLEVIIGHKKVQNFKKALTPSVLHQLSILIDEGKLAIYTSDQIHYHSKLYICHNENGARLINGSANFTRTGTGIKGRQWGYYGSISTHWATKDPVGNSSTKL